MFQFPLKSANCLKFTIAATVGISLSPLQVSAVELEKMFDSLEPAYTTMAGAEECDLKLEIGTGLWRYAEMRVKDLETRSGLSDQQLGAKRETAEIEGRQVAAIGACGSVLVAFQVLEELRKATGQPYPDEESNQTKAKPSSDSDAPKKNKQDMRSLISEWKNAYIACRGGFGNQESTWAACGKRDDIAEELARNGFCEDRVQDGSPSWIACGSSK